MSSHRTDLIVAAHEWVSKSSDPTISSNRLLLKSLTKSARRLRILEGAHNKKPAFAIYGASQAGKSYLANSIAKGSDERLLLRVGDDQLRFDDQVNPAGGQESTGLVTRFTLDKNNIRKSEFPIHLRLLALSDIVKLILNSFIFDISLDEDYDYSQEKETIDIKLSEIENKGHKSTPNVLNKKLIEKECLHDIEDYCRKKYKVSDRIRLLDDVSFWARQEHILTTGSFEDIKQTIQLMWMDLPRYNELFEILLGGLHTVMFANDVFCSLECLIDTRDGSQKRKAKSIINVQVLQDLNDVDELPLSVLLEDDSVAEIRPSILSALTAEISFSISKPANKFFESADLLDFPGARSRKTQPIKVFNESVGLPIEEYNRGKVAFLFDKYVSEFEISGMLLCVEGGPQEVVGLNVLIDDWVCESHGQEADNRDQLPCTLFFILTKFDQLFVNVYGIEDGPGRWETRLNSSLIEPFGGRMKTGASNWVHQWDKSGSFKNVFWLRNPSFDFSAMVDYEDEPGKSKEVGFRSEKKEFLEKLRLSFLQSSVAKKYFKNASKSWDEGCRLNDGGVSYILEEITNVASSRNRETQLSKLILGEIKRGLLDITKFFIPVQEDELRAQKEELAKTLIRCFDTLLQKERLGEFVSMLLVREQQVRSFLERVKRERERDRMAPRQVGNIMGDRLTVPEDPFLASLLHEKPAFKPETNIVAEDMERAFYRDAVRGFIAEWVHGLRDIIGRSETLNYLYLDQSVFVSLCSEIEATFLVAKLDELAELIYVKANVRTGTEQQRMWQQVSQFTAIMNDFIAFGMVDGTSPSEVPLPGNRMMTIFKQKRSSAIDIKEDPEPYNLQFWRDWIVAMQSAALRNLTIAGFDGKMLDENRIAENSELNKLIDRYKNEIRSIEGTI